MPSDNLFTRLRQKANGLVRNVKRLVGDSLQKQPSGDDAEQSIEEFERLSGRGNSGGWHFDRDEIHRRR
jgi:hypothetical protein